MGTFIFFITLIYDVSKGTPFREWIRSIYRGESHGVRNELQVHLRYYKYIRGGLDEEKFKE